MSGVQDNSEDICSMIRNFKMSAGDVFVRRAIASDLFEKQEKGLSKLVKNDGKIGYNGDIESANTTMLRESESANTTMVRESANTTIVREYESANTTMVRESESANTTMVRESESEAVQEFDDTDTTIVQESSSMLQESTASNTASDEGDVTINPAYKDYWNASLSDSWLQFGEDVDECFCPGCYMRRTIKILDRHALCPLYYDGNESLNCSGFSVHCAEFDSNPKEEEGAVGGVGYEVASGRGPKFDVSSYDQEEGAVGGVGYEVAYGRGPQFDVSSYDQDEGAVGGVGYEVAYGRGPQFDADDGAVGGIGYHVAKYEARHHYKKH